MQDKIYVISRHDEGDNITRPYYYTDDEAKAIAKVKELNEKDGLSITLDDDGSMADIEDDDAIWYDYDEVESLDSLSDNTDKDTASRWPNGE